MRVALLDRANFPRPKLCGGLLTAKTIQILERVFPSAADACRRRRIFHHRSRRYAVFARRRPLYFGCLDQPFWFADRCRYDRLLVACAAEAGADVFFKTRVAGFRPLSNPTAVEIFGGRTLPYGGFLESPGVGPVLLAGDAAGFADPLLGEGVYYAHRSGELAATAVLASLRQPAAAAGRHARLVAETILPEFRAALSWRRLLYSAGRTGGYLPVAFLLRRFHRPCEAAVQGKRSFSLFRRENRAVGTLF
jgi:flavin-dependent dehydrogenase